MKERERINFLFNQAYETPTYILSNDLLLMPSGVNEYSEIFLSTENEHSKIFSGHLASMKTLDDNRNSDRLAEFSYSSKL
ncbi:hypothetical protein CEXT_407791 [Caerostris extrusa]|uniref:Uncharacterized protein n=1 Tax=Caerostris extrusa TaxID=172846 RepID=A0AAV4MRV1_CAEEX|nr:hypothetical protein CEXT_407791 [Caerostris extrusa]